ncbi:hypothetical protein JZU71_04455 [bacterium]|nr:hypothetical protein [bacterium]
MVRTLTGRDDYPHILQVIYPELTNIPISEVSNLLLTTLMGRELPMWYAASGCCMIRRNNLSVLIRALYGDNTLYTEQIRRYFCANDQTCSQALDLFACPEPLPVTIIDELEQAVRIWEVDPDNPRFLNRLLALLQAFNCTEDARMIWARSMRQQSGLQTVWGGLSLSSE